MDDDIAHKMWAAIIGECPTTMQLVEKDEQLSYLKAHINDATHEIKRAVGRLVVSQGYIKHMSLVNDGTAIRLDTLPDELIQQMYDALKFGLSKNNDALIAVTNGI